MGQVTSPYLEHRGRGVTGQVMQQAPHQAPGRQQPGCKQRVLCIGKQREGCAAQRGKSTAGVRGGTAPLAGSGRCERRHDAASRQRQV